MVFTGAGVEVTDRPHPAVVDAGDAVVRVTAASICGSDIHLLEGRTPGMAPGTVIGHEFVGLVEDAGPETTATPGDRVAGSFLIACGDCPQCSNGRYNFCAARRALGMGALHGDLDGAQAELVRVPRANVNLRRLGAGDPPDVAALFSGDVMATGFYAAHLAGAAPGMAVAVIGAGPVGLFCAAAVRSRGAAVTVLDTDAHRAAFARERFGLDAAHSAEAEPDTLVAERFDGRLADVAIEAVGHAAAFKAAMRTARDGGVIVVVGVYGKERYSLPMGTVWVRGLDLRFAGMANVHAHWGEALEAVKANRIDPAAAVTHEMALEDAPRGYELFRARRAMKVVLRP